MKKYDPMKAWLEERWDEELSGKEIPEIYRLSEQLFGSDKIPDITTLRRWIQNLKVGDLATTYYRHPAVLEFVEDVRSMDWTIDELLRRGVPQKEAHQMLKLYGGCLERQRMPHFGPLEDDPRYLTLCFRVKLYEGYPSMSNETVQRLERILAMGLDVGGGAAKIAMLDEIKRLLAHYSAHPKRPRSISRKFKELLSGNL